MPLDDPHLKQTLQSLNEPQACAQNLENLKVLGGIDVLLALLETSADRGLNEVDFQRRQLLGTNVIPTAPRKSFYELFVDTFDDATLQILICAAVVSLAIGLYDDPTAGYVEGTAILAAVLIVSLVTAINDYQKESQFRQLSTAAATAHDVVVVRQGRHWQVPATDIMVGDVVCVETGDCIPCDGVLLTTAEPLQVDESALTGEPDNVDKNISDPFLLSGCTVETGRAQLVATAVGRDSQWGVIQAHLEKEQDQTPLQEKLDDMAALIGYVGMAAAALTFGVMMAIKVFLQPDYLQETSVWAYCLEAFIIGVTIVVVAVPEGLPLAVTISLAFSTKKMLNDQNLIRHLAACETMGNATNICSDKTGTLTENRMTVVSGIFADTVCDDTMNRIPVLISDKALHRILEGIACGTTAKILKNENDGPPQIVGNKTEAAFLLLAQSDWSSNDDTDKRRAEARFGEADGSRLFAFTSSRKRMSVLVNKDDDWTLYHKGAAELVLQNCASYLDNDGSEKAMTAQKRAEFASIIEGYANDALRCVALAHRCNVEELLKKKKLQPSTVTAAQVEKYLEMSMCLDAIGGIMDPLRQDVVQAVATCQRAGIVVRMVTGDNLLTAEAIAKKAGILKEGKLVEMLESLDGTDTCFPRRHFHAG